MPGSPFMAQSGWKPNQSEWYKHMTSRNVGTGELTRRQVGVDRMLCGSSAGLLCGMLYALFLRESWRFGVADWRTLRPLRGRRGGTRFIRRQSGLATLSVYSTPDRLHSNERGRRHCGADLRVAPESGERADEQGPHAVR
jgi:hypothetical protein